MTYFQSLLFFLGLPLLLLLIVNYKLRLLNQKTILILLLNILIAMIYTTPWDNYLVATRIWWYNPDQVNGLTLGYVPIEEYTFFAVQTLLVGLWTLFVYKKTGEIEKKSTPNRTTRIISATIVGLLGIFATWILMSGWEPGRYLGLILVWACLPIMIQLAFGADILASRRLSLSIVIIPPTIYLWIMDAVSIGSGIWTINPETMTHFTIGVLPIEEMLFFLVTNVLVAFSMTLLLVPDSILRVKKFFRRE